MIWYNNLLPLLPPSILYFYWILQSLFILSLWPTASWYSVLRPHNTATKHLSLLTKPDTFSCLLSPAHFLPISYLLLFPTSFQTVLMIDISFQTLLQSLTLCLGCMYVRKKPTLRLRIPSFTLGLLLPAFSCLLPPAYFLLPTFSCLLSPAYFLLPTSPTHTILYYLVLSRTFSVTLSDMLSCNSWESCDNSNSCVTLSWTIRGSCSQRESQSSRYYTIVNT